MKAEIKMSNLWTFATIKKAFSFNDIMGKIGQTEFPCKLDIVI